MSEIQDKVLKAIKAGCSTRKEIIAKTGFSVQTINGAVGRLRKWGLVESNLNGKYWIPGKKP